MLVKRASKDDKKAQAKAKHGSLFFPVAVVVLASIPLASVGIADAVGKPIAAILLPLISELRRDSRYGMNLVVLHPGGRDEEVIEPAGG
jgi:hypothetical protein